MPKICYREKRFSADRLEKIEKANAIIDEYRAQGFELTLRQLYYQFVSRDLIANNQREYKNLGDVINDGRLAGLIDWEAIVDRTRELRSVDHWDCPADIISACASQFRTDKWASQEYRVEVWIEKDALVGVIEGICKELDVPYFSCRGYTSQSEMWSAAMRLKGYKGQTPYIIHLGDHDPSGMDMSRDITDRLAEFAGKPVEVNRIALNPNQVEQYHPPPNPCKLTDSRATGYMAEHGDESWELDALEPRVIADLIRDTVHQLRNLDAWDKEVDLEAEHRRKLKAVSDKWNKLTSTL